MLKDVHDPLLQLRVLLDFRIILVVVGEHSLDKPGGMKKIYKTSAWLAHFYTPYCEKTPFICLSLYIYFIHVPATHTPKFQKRLTSK